MKKRQRVEYILVSNRGRQSMAVFKTYHEALRGKELIEGSTRSRYQILPFVGDKKRARNDKRNGA